MAIDPESAVTATGRRRRQWRRTQTKDRIFRAAVDLFSTTGYVAATVEEIAESADVAKGTFFNYFHSKDDLLIAMIKDVANEFEAYKKGIPDTQDVRGHLRDFAHRFVEAPIRCPMLLRNVLGVALTDPEIGRAFNEGVLDEGLKAHSALLRRGQKLGQVRTDIPAPLLARMFQQMMLGTEAIWALTRESQLPLAGAQRAPTKNGDLIKWLDRALDVYWAGIGEPSPKPKRNHSAKAPRRTAIRAKE